MRRPAILPLMATFAAAFGVAAPTGDRVHPPYAKIEGRASKADPITLERVGEVAPNSPQIDDWTFVRRVWLDLAGRLPDFEEAQAFAADDDPQKRAKMIDRVLASEAYVDRWTAFFGEIFHNFWQAPEALYRNAFHFALRDMIAANRPYDQMARAILTDAGKGARAGSAFNFWAVEGFEEEFRLDFLDDQVSFISAAFLGVQTECVSCHDGAGHLEQINKGLAAIKREQFWGMAALLAETHFYLPSVDKEEAFYQELRLVDLDDPGFEMGQGQIFEWEDRFTDGEYHAQSEAGEGMRPARKGGVIPPRYLFTGEAPKTGETRREALARMITADRQFARNIVNRIWRQLTGEGFVEPVDAWDLGRVDPAAAAAFDAPVQPKNRAVMEWLAQSFIDSGYDLKALMRTICNTPYYQMSHAGAKPSRANATSLSKRARRLEAETLTDAIHMTLGAPRAYFAEGVYDRAFHSAWALPGSEEPSGYWLYEDNRGVRPGQYGYESWDELFAVQWLTSELLRLFGRADRETRGARDNSMDVKRSLALMNNDLFNHELLGWEGGSPLTDRLASSIARGEQTVESALRELIMRVLYREPTAAELALFLRRYDANDPQLSLNNAAWALFNHPDFLYR